MSFFFYANKKSEFIDLTNTAKPVNLSLRQIDKTSVCSIVKTQHELNQGWIDQDVYEHTIETHDLLRCNVLSMVFNLYIGDPSITLLNDDINEVSVNEIHRKIYNARLASITAAIVFHTELNIGCYGTTCINDGLEFCPHLTLTTKKNFIIASDINKLI